MQAAVDCTERTELMLLDRFKLRFDAILRYIGQMYEVFLTYKTDLTSIRGCQLGDLTGKTFISYHLSFFQVLLHLPSV